jgi:hypothetical protein
MTTMHKAKIALLQVKFPTLNISSGYIGNDGPGKHSDRSYRIFTNLKHDDGTSVSVQLEAADADFDFEDVSLFLQNRLVHTIRRESSTLADCPCNACSHVRARKRWEEGSAPIRPLEVTEAMLKRLAADWSQIAGEPVRVEHISGAIYGFASELATLRLERKYRPASKRARALQSPAYGWTFSLEV